MHNCLITSPIAEERLGKRYRHTLRCNTFFSKSDPTIPLHSLSQTSLRSEPYRKILSYHLRDCENATLNDSKDPDRLETDSQNGSWTSLVVVHEHHPKSVQTILPTTSFLGRRHCSQGWDQWAPERKTTFPLSSPGSTSPQGFRSLQSSNHKCPKSLDPLDVGAMEDWIGFVKRRGAPTFFIFLAWVLVFYGIWCKVHFFLAGGEDLTMPTLF